MLPVVIVFNNYFHDLATGVFFGCAVALWGVSRSLGRSPEGARYLRPVYDALSRALWISLAWVLIAGIPRTLYFPDYEFIPALDKGLVLELVLKHVVLVSAVGFGLIVWWRVSSLFREQGSVAGTTLAGDSSDDMLESPTEARTSDSAGSSAIPSRR